MRYFIIHSVRRHEIEKYQTSIAGGNFSFNLMDAGIFDKVYSILPSNVYNYEGELSGDDFDIVYSKSRRQNKVSMLWGLIVENWRLFRMIEKGSAVWLYNLCILNVFLFVLLKLFKHSVGVNIILADFSPGEGVNSLYLKLINKADGLITLSNSPLFTVKNLKILPGIVPTRANYPRIEPPIKRNFQLSGNLKERISSTTKVMEAFSSLYSLSLNISGRTPEGVDIKHYSDEYDNITYQGVLSFDDFKTFLDSNSFVLSTRDPIFPENQCNFPSKVLEALLHNRIIISTIHYPQLDGVKYFEVPCDTDGIRKAIVEIAAMDDDELIAYANQGEKVMQMFSPDVWKKEIEKLEAHHGE